MLCEVLVTHLFGRLYVVEGEKGGLVETSTSSRIIRTVFIEISVDLEMRLLDQEYDHSSNTIRKMEMKYTYRNSWISIRIWLDCNHIIQDDTS